MTGEEGAVAYVQQCLTTACPVNMTTLREMLPGWTDGQVNRPRLETQAGAKASKAQSPKPISRARDERDQRVHSSILNLLAAVETVDADLA